MTTATERASPPQNRATRFIDSLAQLVPIDGNGGRGDRAALARLRRSLSQEPGTDMGAMPYVASFLPEQPSPGTEALERAYFLVAGLFALHPRDWRPAGGASTSNLGASFALLHRDTGSDSIEARFRALLVAPGDALPTHLRHAVQLFKAHDIPVNWAQLLRDIEYWESGNRSVQRNWARTYWRGGPVAQPEGPADEPIDNETTNSEEAE